MHALRGNFLASQTPTVGGMAPAHPLRRMQLHDRATQQTLSHRKGPGAITISLMLSAPAPVETAGHPNTIERSGVTKNTPRKHEGKLSQPNKPKPMKLTKKELAERKAKAAEIAAMYATVANGGRMQEKITRAEAPWTSLWISSNGPTLSSNLSHFRAIPAPKKP